MDFFIKESNIRGGNRGGKNLFNWNDVRLLSSRDRQSYLGSTQALGLMDRGGKWYKRDWWTHYNTPVNVYGKKDKLNNREALLEEQKEIRIKEKEKLNEFIYGKKKKNTNFSLNEDEIFSQHGSHIKLENLDNKSVKKEFDTLSRPGLGMNKTINEEKKINEDKEKIITQNDNSKKRRNEDDKKENKNHSSHHHHHHHHKKHNDKSHKSKNRDKYDRSRSGNRSRSRSRSRSISRSRSKSYKKRKKSGSKFSDN